MRLKLLSAICAVSLFACGAGIEDDTLVISGAVHIYGNEPHTYAGIVSEDGKTYAVYPPEVEAEIALLQGLRVEFTLRFLKEPRGEGSRYLTDGTVTPLSWRILAP